MAIAFTLKKVRTAFVLAWKKEANWASVPVYAAYSLVRPVSGAMLIWIMFATVGRPPGYLEPAWFSNAAFQLVPAVLGGTAMAVLEDRERYQMFKYVYLAPGSVIPYFMGHALARTTQALFGALVLVATGALVFGLRAPEFHPLLLVASVTLGLVSFIFLGLGIAGGSLLTARHGNFMSESIAGVFFLFSGVVFPIDTLPSWMRPVCFASPATWFLEGFRRSLGLKFGSTLATFSDGEVLGILGGFAIFCVFLGFSGWGAGERKAKWKGMLDQTTAY